MESFLNTIGALLSGLFNLAQGGFDGVNQITGLIIALVAAFLMPAWSRLGATALGAVLVDRLVMVLRPVLDGGQFTLPPLMTLGFWLTCLALFLGYAIVIAVFFFIKSLFTGAGHRHGHRHAH